uniref:Uncharacterized protein n=1 Tax=Aegilops tauschii subsp. strangulata TaxID=200361 RepID=A0A453MNC2_AEGTS
MSIYIKQEIFDQLCIYYMFPCPALLIPTAC